jgi:dihydroxyacetone kinase
MMVAFKRKAVSKRTPRLKTVTDTTAITLSIPVAKPRNRIAVDPLLKKSGAHADKRKHQLRDLVKEARDEVQNIPHAHRNRNDG